MARNLRTFTPKEAAEAVGCSPDTIRRYCMLYSRHLSEGATPDKGRPRVLTGEDVELLKIAKRQTELGETVEAVDSMLETVALPLPEETFEIEPTGDQVEELPEGFALMRQMVNTLDRVASQDDRLDNQDDRLLRLEEELQRLREAVETAPRVVEKPVETKPFLSPSTLVVVALVVFIALALLALIVAVTR